MADYPVKDSLGNVIISGDGGTPNTQTQEIEGVAATAINTNLLTGALSGWLDVSGIAALSVQIVGGAGISAGAVTFEQTNDKTVAAAIAPAYETSIATAVPITAAVAIAANTSRMFMLPINSRFVRVRVSTAFVGGAVRATASGRNINFEPGAAQTLVTQPTAASLKTESVGPAAHDAVIAGNPNRIAARALAANYTAVAGGDVADLVSTLVGALVVRPFGIPETDWTYAALAGGIINTTDVALAAAVASNRRYLTGLQIRNASATVATEVVVKDGATVIWRGQYPVNSPMDDIEFPTPLKTAVNAALNIACITTGAAVYVNAQGYTAP